MRRMLGVCGLAVWAVWAVGAIWAAEAPKTDAPDAPKTVTLDAAGQTRLGVTVTKLTAAAPPYGVATQARVLDPGPLLAVDSELAASEASLNASRAEADRTRKLYAEDRTASARAVEMATSAERADREKVASARRRLNLEWGEGVAALSAQKRAALLDDLARVHAELVRVELPPGTSAPRSGANVEILLTAQGPAIPAIVLGTMPAADPRLQTRGLLVQVKGTAATLPIGGMLAARIPGETGRSDGVLLPRAALLRKDSKVWAYVQTGPASFTRREVTDYQLTPQGWFITKGFSPGDRVVTVGAASLISIEVPADAAD